MEERTDRFLVKEGKFFKFLCRDQAGFYLLPIGKFRDSKREAQLRQLSVEEITEQAESLNVEIIPLSAVKGVAIGGVEAEDFLYFYLPEKRRRLTLREDLRQEYLDWFFCDIKRNQPPKDRQRKENPGYWRKELQNPGVKAGLKWIKPALILLSLTAAIGFVFARSLFWLLACALCVAVPVALDICLPAYFTLRSKKAFSSRFAISLLAPLVIVGFLLALMSLSWRYLAFPWRLLKLAGLCGMVSAIVMLLAKEFRREKHLLAGVFLAGFVLGAGFLIQVNQILPQPEPERITGQVVDLRVSAAKGRRYYCEFRLPDGRWHIVSVGRDLFYSLEEGGEVLILEYPGALDVPFFTVESGA